MRCYLLRRELGAGRREEQLREGRRKNRQRVGGQDSSDLTLSLPPPPPHLTCVLSWRDAAGPVCPALWRRPELRGCGCDKVQVERKENSGRILYLDMSLTTQVSLGSLSQASVLPRASQWMVFKDLKLRSLQSTDNTKCWVQIINFFWFPYLDEISIYFFPKGKVFYILLCRKPHHVIWPMRAMRVTESPDRSLRFRRWIILSYLTVTI